MSWPWTGVVEGDAVLFEQVAEGAVEFDAGLLVIAAGGDFGAAGLGEEGLVLHDEEVGGLTELELVALGLEELLLVAAAGFGGVVGGEAGFGRRPGRPRCPGESGFPAFPCGPGPGEPGRRRGRRPTVRDGCEWVG